MVKGKTLQKKTQIGKIRKENIRARTKGDQI